MAWLPAGSTHQNLCPSSPRLCSQPSSAQTSPRFFPTLTVAGGPELTLRLCVDLFLVVCPRTAPEVLHQGERSGDSCQDTMKSNTSLSPSLSGTCPKQMQQNCEIVVKLSWNSLRDVNFYLVSVPVPTRCLSSTPRGLTRGQHPRGCLVAGASRAVWEDESAC